MDLGIRGKRAIVCGASKGLGRGCAEALAAEGVDLVVVARTVSVLEISSREIQERYKVKVQPIAVDITTEEGRAKVLAACPDPDILVTNAGGPPGGEFRQFKREDWLKAVDANMVTPISVGSSRVDLQACKLEYSIVSPK